MTVSCADTEGWGLNIHGVFLPACFPTDPGFSGSEEVEGSGNWKGSLNARHCHS